MRSKSEAFKLISPDRVNKEIDSYKERCITLEEKEIISLLHRLLPWLKDNKEFSASTTSTNEMQVKVLALMKGIIGYIAEETEQKKDSPYRFIHSDEGVKLLYPKDAAWVDLEGSNPEIMLPTQLYLLLIYYFSFYFLK